MERKHLDVVQALLFKSKKTSNQIKFLRLSDFDLEENYEESREQTANVTKVCVYESDLK